jgi:Putative prokaryotic signal transducing protein
MAESLVAVSSFWSVPEAHVARNQLEAAGIRAVLQGEEGASTIGIGNLTGGVKVLVRGQDLKRALSVLAETSADLEKALEGDAWEEGSHDEDRRAMEYQTDDEPTEDSDENDQLVTPGDHTADHAHRVAYMGVLVFPILSHLYSSWLLFRRRWDGQELTRAGERAAAKAARLNAIFLSVGAVFLAIYILSLLVR